MNTELCWEEGGHISKAGCREARAQENRIGPLVSWMGWKGALNKEIGDLDIFELNPVRKRQPMDSPRVAINAKS